MIIIHILLAILIIALSYEDVASTKAFLANNSGYEANPLMAWLMKVLPSGWSYVRIGAGAALAALSFLLPDPYGVVVLALLSFYWGITVWSNWRIAKNG